MLNIRNMFSGAKGLVPSPSSKQPLATSSIVLIVLLILSIANFLFFFILLNYTRRTNEAIAKLSAMELALSKGFQDSGAISGEIQKLNLKIDTLQAGLKELKKEGESRDFAIENLTKAKNTLFNRLSELESK